MSIANQTQQVANKKAATPKKSSDHMTQGHHSTSARLPQKLNSVTAETLARLLNGQALSQQDATRLMSCTRLGSIIHDLRHSYGWQIDTLEESTPTNDGRIARYARYYLSEGEILRMSEQERVAYMLSVFAARQALREGKA